MMKSSIETEVEARQLGVSPDSGQFSLELLCCLFLWFAGFRLLLVSAAFQSSL